jgi:hypothetical protein
MVKKRLRNLVNVALLSNGGGDILVRVALVCVCGLGDGILGAGSTAAEDLAPEQASAFVGSPIPVSKAPLAWGAFSPTVPS